MNEIPYLILGGVIGFMLALFLTICFGRDESTMKLIIAMRTDLSMRKGKMVAQGGHASTVTDRGDTEFHGEPTVTCIAIGPGEDSDIDEITGHLKLL